MMMNMKKEVSKNNYIYYIKLKIFNIKYIINIFDNKIYFYL